MRLVAAKFIRGQMNKKIEPVRNQSGAVWSLTKTF